MSLSIIIPVYNEKDQIDYTIKKISKLKSFIKDIEIIFVDDFSKDGSFELIKKYIKKKKFFRVIKNTKKGLGQAIQEGIKKSTSKYICIFMCDMSDDLNDVKKYYNLIKKNDLDAVFGSRFLKNSKVKDYPIFKLILNRIANNLIKFIFFKNYNDFTNAFKIYKKKTLLKLFPIISEGFNVFLELPLKIINRRYRYQIIPINWNGRTKGKSKFKIKEIGSMYLFTLIYCLSEKILLNKRKI